MKKRSQSDLLGRSLTWLSGGALALDLLLVIALLAVLAVNGLGAFWQHKLVRLTLRDGTRVLGEIHAEETIPEQSATRMLVKVGNRELTALDFRWIDEANIATREWPEDATLLERLEWGNFYGALVEIRRGGSVLASGPDEVWSALGPLRDQKRREAKAVHELEVGPIDRVNRELERLRLDARKVARQGLAKEEEARRVTEIEHDVAAKQAVYETLTAELASRRATLVSETVIAETVDGKRKEIPVSQIVRAIQPNRMGTAATMGLYASRLWEFVSADPRESNTEGGIFPAIFGTVLMVFLMAFAVAPLGVLAALYLREYAKQGVLVQFVRIAVSNLAGVPSIVFGVFGLGFFVYGIGGSIDALFYRDALPAPTYGTGGILWASLTLALLTVPVVIVATEEGLAAVPRIQREGSLALGATRFETIRRVVLPGAAPGILTGMILAMARAAGEVAPLMIVGMVKLAPSLPIDGEFPFVHLERKFMHLGFHIYDLGFQSPNVEATKPLVFATALLLVGVVVLMNLVAIIVRNRLRQRYTSSAV
ncbi:MAG: phosphate ABC transporter permease PstA [Planctomycetes bacterium]|nr:phosphate ABC transporter permease PstA [Planctomycetota bacterium]